MNDSFDIDVQWMSSNESVPEIRETSALLRLSVNNRLATRAEDDWSKSVRPSVHLSAYPLALWFVDSWWRLRWEPSFDAKRRDNEFWKMAHEMPAAGSGYIWPPLRFESDGERVRANCSPGSSLSSEPIRYLEHFDTSISACAFERAIDNFVPLVIARLDTQGIHDTALHYMWSELVDDRRTPESVEYRRIEARLGFEPDDAPNSLVDGLLRIIPQVGADAISELAPVCSGRDPQATFASIERLAEEPGIESKVPVELLTSFTSYSTSNYRIPGDRGRAIARYVRSELSLGLEPLSDDRFSEILGLPRGTLTKRNEQDKPLGLAVRNGNPNSVKLIFRRKARTSRRFEAARFLADEIMMPFEERWLPATDAKTARQKTQRAFAAELLCPIDALTEYLESDYSSDDAINEAGEYFGISSLAIRSHLANNGLIGSTEVGADW
jgi:hypothetical protein